MNNFDILELCARNLLRRRTRTILAVSGVIIGTCAIVVMLSIGFGLADSFQKQIESYGNLHMVDVYSGMSGMGRAGAQDDRGVINDKTLKTMEKIRGVTAVTPIASEYVIVAIGKKVAGLEVMGIKPEVLEKFNFEVKEGRLLTSADKNAILFGSQTPYFFYNPNTYAWSDKPTDVMTDKIILTGDWEYGRKKQGTQDGQKIVYKEHKVRGIGVLASENDQSSYRAYMKLEELEKIQAEVRKARGERPMPTSGKTYERALVYVGNINDSASVSKELRDGMGLQAYSPSDWLEAMKQTARMIQGVLGGIGGISLFVAALGITNTMIMSIYERTKEIGVMKVIGANLKDIRKLFMLEAGLIGFIGGAFGIILSLLLSLLMNTVLKDVISIGLGQIGGGYGDASISIIPWWVVLAALAFATAIGMAAGFYPAKRAMNLSALESLRNE